MRIKSKMENAARDTVPRLRRCVSDPSIFIHFVISFERPRERAHALLSVFATRSQPFDNASEPAKVLDSIYLHLGHFSERRDAYPFKSPFLQIFANFCKNASSDTLCLTELCASTILSFIVLQGWNNIRLISSKFMWWNLDFYLKFIHSWITLIYLIGLELCWSYFLISRLMDASISGV